MTPISYTPSIENPKDLITETIPSDNDSQCDIILQVEPSRRLTNLCGVPVLIVTSEAGYHAHYDHATVAYLKQAGVGVTWLNLPANGVQGNGHFMFLEHNSLDIAQKVHTWVDSLEGG